MHRHLEAFLDRRPAQTGDWRFWSLAPVGFQRSRRLYLCGAAKSGPSISRPGSALPSEVNARSLRECAQPVNCKSDCRGCVRSDCKAARVFRKLGSALAAALLEKIIFTSAFVMPTTALELAALICCLYGSDRIHPSYGAEVHFAGIQTTHLPPPCKPLHKPVRPLFVFRWFHYAVNYLKYTQRS